MKLKRIGAFLIDLIIAFVIITLVVTPLEGLKSDNYVKEEKRILNKLVDNKSTVEDTKGSLNDYYKLTYNNRKKTHLILSQVLPFTVLLLYFIIIPFINKTGTLGMIIFKLKFKYKHFVNLYLRQSFSLGLITLSIILSLITIFTSYDTFMKLNMFKSFIGFTAFTFNLIYLLFSSKNKGSKSLSDALYKVQVEGRK